MTPDEHAHVQKLEATVKRYRRRIVELKKALESYAHCGHGCVTCHTTEVADRTLALLGDDV